MLGVYTALSSVSHAISTALQNVFTITSLIWQLFERYGWRILIASIAAWHFIQRIWTEHDRRLKIKSRLQAADPSRVAALNQRRDAVIDKMDAVHEQSIQDKKRRDEQDRLRRLHELERRIVGSGHRLGSD